VGETNLVGDFSADGVPEIIATGSLAAIGYCSGFRNKAFRKLGVIHRIGSKAVRDGWKDFAHKWKDFSEPLGLIFSLRA
jgi:hypothetical protein